MTEGLMLAILIALALSILAFKMKSLPIMFISSLGWLIAALQVYEQTQETLPMALMMMLSFGQFFLIKRE
jgi:hypothetical protein